MSRLKTAAQKTLEGTARKDRKAITPTPLSASALKPPKDLSPAELAEWKRIAPILESAHLVNDADRSAVADYVAVDSLVGDLRGRLVNGDQFYDQERHKYPLPMLLLAAIKTRGVCADRLGLSPASRAKVTPLGEPAETDPLEQLMREREAHPN